MARRRERTTLELARLIADAVLAAGDRRHADSCLDAPTQAVLRTLERERRWFMKYDADADGIIVGGTEKRLP